VHAHVRGTGRRLTCAALVLTAALFALAPLTAQKSLPRAASETVGLSGERLRDAADLLQQFVKDGKIAGAVAAVARRGQLAWLEAAGVQDLETRSPMSARSLFRIYSMTKPVTAVAVMMLHEDGRFRLTDPVARYLPAFKNVTVATEGGTRPPTRDMTIEDLLLHTSGLNHRTSEVYRRAQVRSRSMTLDTFMDNITRVPLMEDPGTRFRYSEATTVLGRLVEIWSGKPFDVFLNERLFGPLAMNDTMFWVPADSRARLTTVYAPGAAPGLTPIELETLPFTERPTLIEGAVGLVSTVPDYLRFCQMLLNGGALEGTRVLKAETVARMTANGLPESILAARGGAMGWGLANVNVVLSAAAGASPANRGEYGWDGTAGTIFWVDPSTQMITVLMTQSSPANPDSIRQRFKTIVQRAVIE
jgi:CubicO group peptidase (beta-lactamase class C family)